MAGPFYLFKSVPCLISQALPGSRFIRQIGSFFTRVSGHEISFPEWGGASSLSDYSGRSENLNV